MVKNTLILLIIIASLTLVGARCTPAPLAEPSLSPILEPVTEPVSGSGEGEDLVGLSFVTYTNKAVGYTILRPNNWYWRHYIANEIASSNPAVVDYFVTDSQPLPGLGSEYLGKIVIEVSSRALSEYADAVVGLLRQSARVGGLEAERYAGKRTNQADEGQQIVEYQFSYQDKSWRLIFTSPEPSNVDQAIFEQVVSSFKF